MAVKQTIIHPDHPMIKVRVKTEGARVHNPSSGKRLVYGETTEVPDAPYWRRRVKDGHVEIVEGDSSAPSKTEAPSAVTPAHDTGAGPITTAKKHGEKEGK